MATDPGGHVSDADAGKVIDYLANIRVKPKDLSTILSPTRIPTTLADRGDQAWFARVRSPLTHRADFIARKRVYDGPSGPQNHPGTQVDIILDDGQKLDGLEVIFTPGHTAAASRSLDPAHSLLIRGDAVNNGVRLPTLSDDVVSWSDRIGSRLIVDRVSRDQRGNEPGQGARCCRACGLREIPRVHRASGHRLG